MSINCYKCSKDTALSTNETVARNQTCPHCWSDLRCCKMCKHYDTSSYNECREPVADRITDKEKANFCDYYVLNSNTGESSKSKDDLLSAAAALFKK